ncbi:pteridine reductase [Marinobacterium arenosum]|uniref:pteridine reductase n=1 Tax=Marinobacterium arenosum TaxID=2862496 RepID=UPI001C963DC4|nr:pteridine reductase [Marinobacterium arenosum]MBY4676065.1 pteridine reductase [Marinobacterium arenosum]
MSQTNSLQTAPVALITGGARRIGAEIARQLHRQGYRVLIHYRHSEQDAQALATELNQAQPDSARLLQANLTEMAAIEPLARQALTAFGRLDLLVNNASSFFPTPLADSSQAQWDELINANLRAPYFLTAALSDALSEAGGCVINLIDIHAQRALPGYPIYSIAKAGLQMMTLSLAKELAPAVRVNGVAPGPILWPEAEAALDLSQKEKVVDKTLLGRTGTAGEIAEAVGYLAGARFVTGQILAVDGGKSLYS